jgi:hypothetical protein
MMDMKTMLVVNQRPQSSLVSRFTAGAFGDHNAAEAFFCLTDGAGEQR